MFFLMFCINVMHNVQRAPLTVNDSAVTQVYYLQPKPQLGGPEVALPQPVAGTIADARYFFLILTPCIGMDGIHGWNSLSQAAIRKCQHLSL